jgi:hypothetical protein
MPRYRSTSTRQESSKEQLKAFRLMALKVIVTQRRRRPEQREKEDLRHAP